MCKAHGANRVVVTHGELRVELEVGARRAGFQDGDSIIRDVRLELGARDADAAVTSARAGSRRLADLREPPRCATT